MHKKALKKSIVFLLTFLMVLSAFTAVSFAGEATDLEWWNFRNNAENNGVTDRPAITDPDFASLKWGVKYGSGWAAAPTPPLILDGYIYIASGKKVMKLDKETGELVAQSQTDMVANVGYAMNPMVYADGKFFVQVGNGIIQAVDFETLEPLWHTEKIGGQTLCPIAYTKIDGQGYIYTGTWNSEKRDGVYFCVTTDDEGVDSDGIKEKVWTFTPSKDDQALIDTGSNINRGFYWAGAYANEKYVAFGSDDGTSEGDYTANGVLYTVNPTTGEIISRIDGIKGDVRSTVVYNDGFLYFTTKGGLLFQVPVDEDGNLGEAHQMDLGGMATASPLVHNGRIYVGVCGQGGQFDPDGGHHFSVISTDGLNLIYDIPIKGYPQAAALMSTAEENTDFNKDGKPDGRVYIYFTYNAQPGGIYYIYDEPGETTPAGQGTLFTPPTNMQQYCISTICQDNEGTLYYKNDSCYLMAVEKNMAYLESATISTDGGEPTWNSDFTSGNLTYSLKVPTAATYSEITLAMPEGATATVNGVAYSGAKHKITLSTTDETTPVSVKVTNEGKEREYTFNITKESSVSTLSNISANNSNAYSSFVALSPTFASDTYEYTTAQLSQSNSFDNLWLDATNTSSKVTVYGVDNVDSSRMTNGVIGVTATSSGHSRYAIYPADKKFDTKVKIVVESENGESTSTYYVTFARTINVTDVAMSKASTTICAGDTETLTAKITPTNASLQDVTWSSDSDDVTVDDNGVIRGVKQGSGTITVTTKDGSKTATCTVTVTKPLADLKNDSKIELANYKNADDYRAAEQTLLSNAITEGSNAIDSATTVAAMNDALTAAKTKIDSIKTDAQYKAEAATSAKDVDDKIDEIGEVTLESKAAIDVAREAYDNLGDEAKADVTKLETLKAAEAKYKELKAAADKAEADKAAAKAATDLINEIGDVTTLSGEELEAAKTAYNKLTDDQKALITSEVKDLLEKAEEKYEKITTTATLKVVLPKDNAGTSAEVGTSGLTLTKGTTTGFTVKIEDIDLNKFTGVMLNGKLVDENYYKKISGSIILEFSKEYVNSLPAGDYTMRVNTTDGYGETALNVKNAEVVPGKPGTGSETGTTGTVNSGNNSSQTAPSKEVSNVKTGDESGNTIYLWIGLSGFALVLFGAIFGYRRRKASK